MYCFNAEFLFDVLNCFIFFFNHLCKAQKAEINSITKKSYWFRLFDCQTTRKQTGFFTESARIICRF